MATVKPASSYDIFNEVKPDHKAIHLRYLIDNAHRRLKDATLAAFQNVSIQSFYAVLLRYINHVHIQSYQTMQLCTLFIFTIRNVRTAMHHIKKTEMESTPIETFFKHFYNLSESLGGNLLWLDCVKNTHRRRYEILYIVNIYEILYFVETQSN